LARQTNMSDVRSTTAIRVLFLGVLSCGLSLPLWGSGEPEKGAGVDFSTEVLPILSDNCFACHGPDEKTRKADLRLDVEEEAKAVSQFGDRAIVPGDPEASLLMERVLTTEPMDLMPPESTGKRLSEAQKEVLRRWIAEGAAYEKHWAFVPPSRPELPAVTRSQWVRNEIDHFVLARLEQEGVEPARRASKRTLARRATLDLTGLPPTPQEVEAFLNDKESGAYERLVDRLLESPRYGEHMARDWMDAARYADSHGFHIDAERHLWKWRSWVVDAYNRNLPFDQFTTEQLAGDLLPEPTIDQKVASGFIRNNMSTGEGGAIVDEYQAKYTFDRTETASTLWLGLTMSCARCHTHKYDPITHREYYGLYAFFNNLEEAVMDGNQPNPEPFLKLPTAAQKSRLDALKQQVEAAESELARREPEAEAARKAWREDWRRRLTEGLTTVRPVSLTVRSELGLEVDAQGAIDVGASPNKGSTHEVLLPLPAGRLGGVHLTLAPAAQASKEQQGDVADLGLTGVEGELIRAGKEGGEPVRERLKFVEAFASSWEGDARADRMLDQDANTAWLPAKAVAGRAQEVFLRLESPIAVGERSELSLRLTTPGPEVAAPIQRLRLAVAMGEGLLAQLFPEPQPAWRLLGPLPSEGPAQGLAKVWDVEEKLDLEKRYQGVKEEVGWRERSDLTDGRTHLLVNSLHGVHGVYYLERKMVLPEEREVEFTLKADDVFRLSLNGDVVAERTRKAMPGDEPVRVRRRLSAGEHQVLLKIANLQGDCYLAYQQDVGDPVAAPGPIAGRLLVCLEEEQGHEEALRRYFLRATDPSWKQRDNDLAMWKDARDEVERSVVTTMVAKERTEVRETRILTRGEYDQPGEVVTAGVPAVLPPLPAGVPANRLGLSKWLMDAGHPLTARVTVNRFWQHYFGVGLVKTAEDFGVQGERPSHPDLLDWLATEFVASGWDVKHMHKLIVMSATYRQASDWRAELAERDPENRLLARGPRFRVDAEVVRDSALAVSGLLVEEVGVPSVKPYEPPGLWEAVSFNNSQKYVQDRGDANYRRSLYTHWKRQSPPPSMLLLDAPSREYCVVRRPRTNTPLQAMVLLNDPQFVEASRAMAWRVMQEGGEQVRPRLRYAFELVTARRPNREELAVLMKIYEGQLEAFRRAPGAAREFLQVGAYRAGGEVDEMELAAMAAVTTLLLNLDEALTKG